VDGSRDAAAFEVVQPPSGETGGVDFEARDPRAVSAEEAENSVLLPLAAASRDRSAWPPPSN
jgi:hypothetical protein